jgi:superkiller protein 3
MGDLYLMRKNYTKAVRCYKESLTMDPEYISGYEKIINAYATHKAYPEADYYFKKLLDLTKNRDDIMRNYILFKIPFMLEKDAPIDDYLEKITEILKRNRNDIEMINTYGFIALNFKNNIPLAKEYFKRALEIDKNYIHSLNNMGVCYMRENNILEAKKQFEENILLSPINYPYSYQNLTIIYLQEENFKHAYDVLIKAENNRVNIESGWDHLKGLLLIYLNDYSSALEWYLEKIKIEPQNNLLVNNLGFCFRKLGNFEQAEKCFSKAAKIFENKLKRKERVDERSLIAYYNLARLALDKSEKKKILDISKKILLINKQDAFATYLKGAACVIDKEYEKAKTFFEATLKISEYVAEIYPDYGFVMGCIDEDFEKAIVFMKRGIELNYGTVLVMNNLAHAYIQSGDLKSAENILKEFHTSKNPILSATRGLLEIRKGNLDKGNELFDYTIRELEGENRNIAKQIKNLENAKFYLNNNDLISAKKHIFLAKEISKSYMNKEIEEIYLRIESKL